jgi:hypothetical protein
MSVETIAEAFLRKATPTNSYLKRWIRDVVTDTSYSELKFQNVKWNTRKPLENEADEAIYDLAKALVLFRADGLNDTPLSKAIMEYDYRVKRIAGKKVRNDNYKRIMVSRWRRAGRPG